jgi:hypothetical protein
MADAGVVRDGNRLPWLEPYRAPQRKPKSNRRPAAAAAIGAIGLAAVVTLLMRDASLFPGAEVPAPQASVVLPAPADMQPQIVLPTLVEQQKAVEIPVAKQGAAPRRAKMTAKRRIKAVPTRAAYRTVVKDQAGQQPTEVVASEAAIAIASLPAPVVAEPPRPAVNPKAQVVRGKTVQLGVYTTARQAELAWQSAVRDYTYLVTMQKSIEPISIRSKRFYRLQLGTPSKQYAKQLCSNLKTIGRACTVA